MLRFNSVRINFSVFLILLCFLMVISSEEYISSGKTSFRYVSGIYRLINGKADGLDICIVDGPAVRRKIYHEFLYGGNDERYLFNPRGEIWIDNSISVWEYRYTLFHELNERSLMAKFGYTYAAAHDSSLKLERQMRQNDRKAAVQHESALPMVSPRDCDGVKQIAEISDSIKLKEVYLQLYDTRDSVSVWVVNGSLVRREIYPDFGLSGNEYVYYFIPKNEIWIDGQVSCEETGFSIARELFQRELMSKGVNYDISYSRAIKQETMLRNIKLKEAAKKPPVKLGKTLEREKGTGGSGRPN
ncbi:MAG: hypothetical protein ACM34K_00550 [Bacillota bacterium]